ncbi:hypothetical protein G6F31_017784 [Rhizopus arrhizus]|nr:hypothetical protein G6F31_017784 [Rhizopus arrhizus]
MNVFTLVPRENSARSPRAAQDFADFWAIFPRRVGKRDAEKAWAKLRPQEKAAAIEAMPKHVEYWNACGREREHIPHPATWLNGARWDDEIELPKPKAAARAGQDAQTAAPGWMASWAGMDGMARQLQIDTARLGESPQAYKARILQAIDDRDRVRKVG